MNLSNIPFELKYPFEIYIVTLTRNSVTATSEGKHLRQQYRYSVLQTICN